jgi:hypothetical protein
VNAVPQPGADVAVLAARAAKLGEGQHAGTRVAVHLVVVKLAPQDDDEGSRLAAGAERRAGEAVAEALAAAS